MSIVTEILESLWNTRVWCNGMRVNLLGVPILWEEKKNSYQSTLSRLRKNGLVKFQSEKWFITNLGKEYLIKRRKFLSRFDFSFPKSSPKNLLIMFDIPVVRENERKWFRLHLKKFDYFMIQKSVWVGPSPLPKDFISYLKEIKLDKCIKTFKLAKPYQIK